jgi:hypothetical protein
LLVPVTTTAPDRNYPALFLALDDVLEALGDGRPDDDALQRSFEGSADGFGAEKALLLLVEKTSPRRLRALASRGLSPEEVAACESGRSVPGVSSSRIREAVDGGVPVMVQDPELLLGAHVTEALRGQPLSVLCAPVCDPRTKRVLAVLYVQNHGVRNAFGEIDRAWIEVYARALGRCLASLRDRPAASPTTAS